MPLLSIVTKLPEFSRHTKQISDQAQAIRRAILDTQAPDQLLFDALPRACGLPPIPADHVADELVDSFVAALRESLQELYDAYPTLLQRLITTLRNALGATKHDPGGLRQEIAERYRMLAARTSDTQLRAFGVRVENGANDMGWVESVGALILRKPVGVWHDSDVASFTAQMTDLGRRFQAAEQLVLAIAPGEAPADVMRIGVTDQHGERSIMVRTRYQEPILEEIHQKIAEVFAEYPTLTHDQRVHILSAILAPYLGQQKEEGS